MDLHLRPVLSGFEGLKTVETQVVGVGEVWSMEVAEGCGPGVEFQADELCLGDKTYEWQTHQDRQTDGTDSRGS